eukprot:6204710-Prorocentrum_lima.AAC.1
MATTGDDDEVLVRTISNASAEQLERMMAALRERSRTDAHLKEQVEETGERLRKSTLDNTDGENNKDDDMGVTETDNKKDRKKKRKDPRGRSSKDKREGDTDTEEAHSDLSNQEIALMRRSLRM